MGKETTDYSEKIKGAAGNYHWPVCFDKTDGFIGITQYDERGQVKERVLLSPRQVKELFGFATNKTMDADQLAA